MSCLVLSLLGLGQGEGRSGKQADLGGSCCWNAGGDPGGLGRVAPEVVRRPPVSGSSEGGARGSADDMDVGVGERGAHRTLWGFRADPLQR